MRARISVKREQLFIYAEKSQRTLLYISHANRTSSSSMLLRPVFTHINNNRLCACVLDREPCVCHEYVRVSAIKWYIFQPHRHGACVRSRQRQPASQTASQPTMRNGYLTGVMFTRLHTLPSAYISKMFAQFRGHTGAQISVISGRSRRAPLRWCCGVLLAVRRRRREWAASAARAYAAAAAAHACTHMSQRFQIRIAEPRCSRRRCCCRCCTVRHRVRARSALKRMHAHAHHQQFAIWVVR